MKNQRFFQNLKAYWHILLAAGKGFANDKATKLSAALAYQTIFSLPPMLLLIIISAGTFYGQQAISGQLFEELRGFIGDSSAMQVQEIMSKINFHKDSHIATIISAIVLVIGATGVFVEIQDSLNIIWGVRTRDKKGFVKILISRLLSFTMIIGVGFLLLVSLMMNAIILSLSNFIIKKFPFIPVNMIDLINNIFTFVIVAILFICVFKMLPDIKIKWKQVIPGAIVTTLLFVLGKFLIGLYISSSTVASLYGAAGSIIILLLWVYYSALILYFGAEFTRAQVEYKGEMIQPNSYAEFSDKILVEEYLEKERAQKIKVEQLEAIERQK